MEKLLQKTLAEAIGTAIFVFGGVGYLAINSGGDALTTALAFGISAMVAMLLVVPISGGHINPAVTLANLITGKIDGTRFWYYLGAQFVGAAVGTGLVFAIAKGQPNFDMRYTAFATNTYGATSVNTNNFTLWSVALTEVIITAILVMAVLACSRQKNNRFLSPIVTGLTIASVYLVAIQVDGASANPARSFGPAIFKLDNALRQLWVFIVFPLLGAALAAGVWKLLGEKFEPATDESPAEPTEENEE